MRSSLLSILLTVGLLVPAWASAQVAPIPTPAQAEPTVQRGWLGVGLDTEPGPLGGVRVIRVFPGSPAEAAGLEADQEVAAINGEAVNTTDELIARVGALSAGTTVTLTLAGTPQQDVEVLLGLRPPEGTDWASRLVGDAFPSTSLAALDSAGPIDVSTSAQLTLVEFWATWCGPCHMSIPRMSELRSTYTEDQLRIVAVSDEDPQTVSAFVNSRGMNYTVALDEDGDLGAELWVVSLPSWFLVDASGEIVGYYTGIDDLDRLFGDVAARVSAP